MPRYILSTEVEAECLTEARKSIRYEDLDGREVKGDNTDPVLVSNGHRVLVNLGDEKFIIAEIHGWFRGSIPYTAARHIAIGRNEFVLSASVNDEEVEKPTTRQVNWLAIWIVIWTLAVLLTHWIFR